MIELRNVSAGYEGRNILKDISVCFQPGQVTAVLGPNGCGKSTLLKTALGILPKTGGEILYDNTEIGAMKPCDIAKKAAYLSQSRAVPHISAGKMVLHGRFPYLGYPRHYRKEDYAAVQQAMERTDCLELINSRMEELSGGQRQKVYLAMALAQNTETLFMDEPTTFLDIGHQLELMELSVKLASEGRAVIMVLHDLPLAMKAAYKLVIMSGGRIIKTGTPEEIRESGAAEEAFGVKICRFDTPGGPRYYCEK